jgi:hypothetical protein
LQVCLPTPVTTSGPDSIHRYFESDQQVSGSYSPVVRTYELNPHPTLGLSSDSNNLKIPYDWCSNHQCTTTATQKTRLWLESTHWSAEHDPNRSSRCISSHVDPMRGTIIRPASSNTAGSAISLAERRTLKPSGTRDVPTQPSPTPLPQLDLRQQLHRLHKMKGNLQDRHHSH